jgi:hypothetical protein
MSTYIITGKVKADSLQTSLGTWHGIIELPVFKVTADSKTEAVTLAKQIINPLQTTDVKATAVEELPDSPSALASLIDAELNTLLSRGAVMTPYEHYCEAERLLAELEHRSSASQHAYDRARVHAALACAVIPERGSR